MKKLPLIFALVATSAFGQIQPERTGVIQTLPESYPAHWILLQDGAFFHMSNGKVIVVDADSDDPAGRVKGMFNSSFIAQFYQSRTKAEMYIRRHFIRAVRAVSERTC